MPFASKFNPVYGAVSRAVTDAELTPLRADDEFITRASMEKILRGIAESEAIVVDTTGRNPNVYYELGIAHVVKANVVLISQDTSSLPFDTAFIDHLPYTPDRDGLATLQEELSRVLRQLPPEPRPRESRVERRRALRRWIISADDEWRKSVGELRRSVHDGVQLPSAIPDLVSEAGNLFSDAWIPIEELALEIVETEPPDEIQVIAPTLEWALLWAGDPSLPAPIARFPSLLALRTWYLILASAIDNELWEAARRTLEMQFNLPRLVEGTQPDVVVSIPGSRWAHHPAATERSADTLPRMLYETPPERVVTRFVDKDAVVGAVAMAYLAAAVRHRLMQPEEHPLYPAWAHAHSAVFRRLLLRLETDRAYAMGFAQTVSLDGDPIGLARRWEEELGGELQKFGRQAPEFPWGLPDLPKKLAVTE
jgi:hypothetical protein